MHRILLSLALVTGLAARASAATDPFATFVSDLAANPKSAAQSLAHCQLLLAPGGEARTPCTLSLADLSAGQSGVTLKASRIKYGDVPQSLLSYLDADIEARAGGKVIATYHVIAVMGGVPDAPGFQPTAMHVARMIPDKDATTKAKAKQLAAAPAIKDGHRPPRAGLEEQQVNDRDQGLEGLDQWLKNGFDRNALGDMLADGGVAFGSAAGQKYTGKAGGKQVKAWKLGLAQQGGVVSDGDDMIVVAATDVVGTLPDKTAITYAAFVVGVMHMEPESGDHLWETKLVSFAVPQ